MTDRGGFLTFKDARMPGQGCKQYHRHCILEIGEKTRKTAEMKEKRSFLLKDARMHGCRKARC